MPFPLQADGETSHNYPAICAEEENYDVIEATRANLVVTGVSRSLETRPPSHSGLTERIGQLERLISSFVDDQNARTQANQFDNSGLTGDVKVKEPQPTSPDGAADPSDSFGHISLRDSKTKYVQDTHWTAILDGIAELKSSVHDEAARSSERSAPASTSPEILFPSLLGRYQDCPPDTIETICGTLNTQFHQSGDGEMSSLVILGVLVRMAQRMGYHRDASHFPHISPFHGEMRRRVWAIIQDLDVMLSLSAGLPRILREFQSDTAPLGIFWMQILMKIYQNYRHPARNHSKLPTLLPPSADRVMLKLCDWTKCYTKLTHRHRNVYMSDLSTGPLWIRQKRFSIGSSLFPYQRYAYSRDSCLEASLKILEYQDLMYQESHPSGRLYHERWKVKSPIMRGVIMLATTLICLELNYELSSDLTANKKHIALPEDMTHRVILALQHSHKIWSEQKDLHHDIPRTIQAIDVIFKKLEKQQNDNPPQAATCVTPPSNQEPVYDSTMDFFSGSNPSAWPELEGAMFIDQAMNFPQLQANNMDSPMSSFTIAPELLDLTNSVDVMLGMSMNYPRTTQF
ncbi:hypothetical protein N7540_011804 [Penicillium herquei]|nr:hypothetical protein N7540_011804 [Penicillium herquei]